MASSIGLVAAGLLHSITTSGMPFTKSTMSGMMKSRPPAAQGGSTRNWLTTRKSLRSGCSKSMKWTGWSRPLPSRAFYLRALEQQVHGLLVGLHELRAGKRSGLLMAG